MNPKECKDCENLGGYDKMFCKVWEENILNIKGCKENAKEMC